MRPRLTPRPIVVAFLALALVACRTAPAPVAGAPALPAPILEPPQTGEEPFQVEHRQPEVAQAPLGPG